MISVNFELGGYSMVVSKGGTSFYTEASESDLADLIRGILEAATPRCDDLVMPTCDAVLKELERTGKKAGDILQDRQITEGSADNG